MMADRIVARLLGVVSGVAGPQRTPPNPGLHTPLAEGGFWLDSVALLETIIACEAEFQVAFDPETDLTPEGLRTVGSLADVIRVKLAA